MDISEEMPINENDISRFGQGDEEWSIRLHC
jgi:hypothetical protein